MVAEKPKRLISWSEISQHATPSTAWIVINNKVYDISHWDSHPGGSVMLTHAGDDATDVFACFHPNSAWKLMDQFYIGELDLSTSIQTNTNLSPQEIEEKQRMKEFITAYRKLRVKVKSMGLYNASTLFYTWKVFSTFAISLISIATAYYGNTTNAYLLAGAIMGLFYQQCGWLAHDYLHQQVCENNIYNNYMGILIGNVWQGFSVQWWKNKHNTHHAVPNLHGTIEEELIGDPDIATMPLLAWSKTMMRKAQDSSIGPFFVKYQAYLYFPLLLLARISWLLQSYLYVFHNFAYALHDRVEYPRLEKLGLILHYIFQIGIPIGCNMSVVQAFGFFMMSQMMCGLLLALVFSVGHNGMSVYDKDTKPDFWKLQVTTTRNITTWWFIDWFCGGLNYQVDHHLFPRVPRHHLPQLNILVKSLCAEYSVPYHETTFTRGLYEVVDHLAEISREFVLEFPAV